MINTNTDKTGRQLDRFSTEGWIELVAEYRNSGLTLKKFTENKGVKPSTFSYWVYKSQRQKRRKKTVKGKSLAFVEVSTPLRNNFAMELKMPNGIRMSLSLSSGSREDISFVIREVATCLD